MQDWLIDYGFFTLKLITVVAGIVIGLGLIISSSARARNKDRETLEITNINEKLEDYKDALEEELLSKDEIKRIRKARKKKEKQENKLKSKRAKDGHEEPIRPRLFVLRFEGDLEASEVENLRSSITSILSVAKPHDEILVILESAGGVVHNYGLAAAQLARIKRHNIQLTIAVDLIAASGGYMMACVGDKIIASPFAVLGSIGVLAEVPNFNRLLKKYDVDIEHHTAGEYKSTLTLLAKNTNKAREKFKEELEDIHVLFKNFVSENRPQLEMQKVATGEAWYGKMALDLNLVDELITSDDYIMQRASNADIYEVSFEINEGITEKISSILQRSSKSLLDNILYKFRYKLR